MTQNASCVANQQMQNMSGFGSFELFCDVPMLYKAVLLNLPSMLSEPAMQVCIDFPLQVFTVDIGTFDTNSGHSTLGNILCW